MVKLNCTEHLIWTLLQKHSGMAHAVNGLHSYTCHPRIYPRMEWIIPAFAFQAKAGSQLPLLTQLVVIIDRLTAMKPKTRLKRKAFDRCSDLCYCWTILDGIVQCYVSAHGEAVWDLSTYREDFVSADNEGSIILWTVKDDNSEGSESLVEKRIAISGMGSVLYCHVTLFVSYG